MNNISDAEWKVMRVLWERSPRTGGEIVERLEKETSWNPKTIHTLIRRLVQKKAVAANKETSFYSYSAAVSEADCVRGEADSFMEKCFNGSLNTLLASFIKNEKLSDTDIDELQALLEAKKKEK
jgi:BlaI family penicillinase repressor